MATVPINPSPIVTDTIPGGKLQNNGWVKIFSVTILYLPMTYIKITINSDAAYLSIFDKLMTILLVLVKKRIKF